MLVAALSAVAGGTVERSAQRGTVGLRFGRWRGGEEDTWRAPTGAALSRACLMLPEQGTLSASCKFYAEFSTTVNNNDKINQDARVLVIKYEECSNII